MVKQVNSISELAEKGMKPKDDELFQHQEPFVYDGYDNEIPLIIEVMSKPGSLDHKPNVLVVIKTTDGFLEELGEEGEDLSSDTFDGERAIVDTLRKLESEIRDRTEAKNVNFQPEGYDGDYYKFVGSFPRLE